jgi:hypothetical protein
MKVATEVMGSPQVPLETLFSRVYLDGDREVP